jgi:hypothetical protein
LKLDFPAPAFLQQIRLFEIIHLLVGRSENKSTCKRKLRVQGDGLKPKQLPKIAKISIPNRSRMHRI